MPRRLTVLLPLLAALLPAAPADAASESGTAPIAWRTRWNQAAFDTAAREHRYVLLDLHAVWCHWCHVMDEETYADVRVRALVARRFVPVSVDADSDPALTSRYGDWGWPATIVLAPDGTEIVKRRGFIAPEQMASLLQAIIDDPTPGPSVTRTAPPAAVGSGRISRATLEGLARTYDALYDDAHGGWGSVHKFVDAPAMEYAFELADAGDERAAARARQTLDANLALLDPVSGGVYQYSDAVDWRSPHFEKLVSFQADDLRLYAEAYTRWSEPAYLHAAEAIHGYLRRFLAAPEGAFYVSQDADLSASVTGHEFYALDGQARAALGSPRVDRHLYARENGWVIRALCRYYDASGDAGALAEAGRAADWVLANRALPGGGFSHDASDRGGPFLDDSVAMGEAFVALYRSTGDRRWLAAAEATLGFVAARFKDPRGGFIAAPVAPGARGVFREPVRAIDQNASLARLANYVFRYTGAARYQRLARHALAVLAGVPADAPALHADVLLADREFGSAPTHVTVVGAKDDPVAQALHAAALRSPAGYLQVDWWDRAEGPLPNPAIRYPALPVAAAFACSENACSTPVYEPGRVLAAVLAARAAD